MFCYLYKRFFLSNTIIEKKDYQSWIFNIRFISLFVEGVVEADQCYHYSELFRLRNVYLIIYILE
jgi:hypothetical protein